MKISKSDRINRSLASIFTPIERQVMLKRKLMTLGWQRCSPVDIIAFQKKEDRLYSMRAAAYGELTKTLNPNWETILSDSPNSYRLPLRSFKTLVLFDQDSIDFQIFGITYGEWGSSQDQAVWIATCKALYVAQASVAFRKGGYYEVQCA